MKKLTLMITDSCYEGLKRQLWFDKIDGKRSTGLGSMLVKRIVTAIRDEAGELIFGLRWEKEDATRRKHDGL